MFKKIATALVVILAVSWATPLAASATETIEPRLAIHVDENDILWVEATLDAERGELVKINLRAPSRDGGYELWQRCSFTYSGPGTYRCGLDVADGSLARKRVGKWKVGLASGGEHMDHTSFSMTR